MLKVSDELKQIYRRNMFPLSTEKANIQGQIVFSDLGVTIGNDRIVSDTFRLTEIISDNGDLDFGSTNASMVEFTVADVPEDLNGKTFTITQTVNGTYVVPFGTFKVESCERQDDLRFKDIVAYDNMQKFNVDVSAWYNALQFPITISAMRQSLCNFCGVDYESVNLVNDNVRVYKTIQPTELNGKEVLRAIAEVNGTFAHMNRYDKLTFIGLDSFALYPSETLYPADDLYPIDVTEIVEKHGENAIAYISSKYEDYEVSAIDGIIVQDDEYASTGIKVGTASNPYILASNMLIVGKTVSELTTIAQNLLNVIGKIVYTPHETESIGLPYVEVGDTVLNANSADKELFIAKRVLTGISSVMDKFSADGNRTRQNNNTVASTEYRKMQGLSTKIIKEIDRVGVEIDNLNTQTNTNFTVIDGRITAEVSRAQSAESSLQLSVNGLRTEISGKIGEEDAKSIFVVEIGKIKLSSKQIELEGYVTANKNFAITEEGTAILSDGEASATMSGGGFSVSHKTYGFNTSYGSDGILTKINGSMHRLFGVGDSGITLGLANRPIASAQISSINGGTPITSSNVGSYVPTNTNQLTGDFREGTNGTYVALANSSGNKYLATTEWVINYTTKKADSLNDRISQLENDLTEVGDLVLVLEQRIANLEK